jgi:hypothetical protein
MKKICFAFLAALMAMPSFAAEKQISSPNGKIVVTIKDDGGTPSYQVTLGGVEFIKTSPLGLVTDASDLSSGLSLTENGTVKKISDSYSLKTIKHSHVDYEANELTCSFKKEDKKVLDIIFRVSDNDVAFCYRIYPKGERLRCVVKEEKSSFVLPEGSTSFLCPQATPMHGFASTSPSYETPYTVDDAIGKNGWGEGYTFPCLFKNSSKGWVLISETGVDGNYCASRLMGKPDGTYTIGFPQVGEMNGQGSVSPAVGLPATTPWRTITLGTTLKPIVETTVPFDLVSPKYDASRDYQYGKGVWSWIIQMDGYTTYPEQKRYIDFAAAMGYKTVLIDALWDTQIGRDSIAALARYGASKNVSLFLWYNSNGAWNDAPQGPRGIMDNVIARRKEMKWMQSIGIRGIKVDFFGGDKQAMMKVYEEILSDANDYGIECIFHGCTLPRGWERMYPNYVASEAVLASENLHFGQGSCDNEAFNGCLHPFIRNTVGSMDFGGSALNKHYGRDNVHGTTRVTSDVYALATAVLFQSADQHFALAPNNLQDAPKWAMDFMKEVPTTWDDIKFIDGYPGKYVVIARRCGDKWYVAGINAQNKTLKKEINLPMLEGGKNYRLYSDNAKLEGSLKQIKISKTRKVTVTIPKNGGWLLVK